MSARMQIMEYLEKNGLTPVDELAAGIGETNRKRLLDNAAAAITDGMIDKVRDEVTNTPAYQLTSKGAARVKNGRMSINGKRAEENKAACDAREAGYEISGHATDAELVESLAKQIAENAALRKKLADALEYNAIANTVLADAETALGVEHRDEIILAIYGLKANMEACQRDQMKGVTLANSVQMKAPLGYMHVWPDGFSRFDSEALARADIVRAFEEQPNGEPSHLCAILDTAQVTVQWSRP